MAVTRARVFVHNETDEVLSLASKEVPDGDWTTPPPDRIEPRSVVVFGSESDGFDPDTEGRATYRIGGSETQTLYVHWNDPLVGGNSFHTNTDDRHYAFWTASPGNHCEAHFTLRPAGRVMTDFRPSSDGFWFGNSFGDVPYSLPPLKGSVLDYKYGNASNGLCGGMVFAALDYFYAGLRIPADTTAPMGEQFPLFTYLVERLFATFSVDSVTLMLALINPAYPDGDENMLSDLGLASGRAAVMAHEEWPIIRADIDAGRPSPMFITTVKSLNPGDLGECHQVLAYGYDVHGHQVTIHVYDPNTAQRPGAGAGPSCEEVHLSFDDGDVSQRIMVTHNVDVHDKEDGHQLPIYCFGRMDYQFRQPTVATEPRLPATEVDRRGVSVIVSEPVTLSRTVTGSGVKTVDIWPNCGQQQFGYTDYAVTQSVSVTGRPHGYYHPEVAWRVGGRAVPEGTDADVAVTGTPVDAETTAPVTVHVRLVDNVLTLTNRPSDGNFSVSVDLRSSEQGDALDPGRTWSTLVSFTGDWEEIPGLGEAMGDCLNKYVKSLQAVPDLEAELAAIYAQLRRPPDPLWDPDPVMVEASALVVATQPELSELEQISHIPSIEAAGVEAKGVEVPGKDLPGAGAGLDTDALKEHVLTEEELAAQLKEKIQEGFGKEVGGFGP